MTNSERGNIIVYVLVGVLLFVAMIGGVYLVKNRIGGQSSPQNTTQNNKPSDTKNNDTRSSGDGADTNPNTTGGSNNNSDETNPTGSSSESNNGTNGSTNQAPVTQGPAPTTTRPEIDGSTPVAASGPADTLANLIALGAVSFSAGSYLNSRRKAASF